MIRLSIDFECPSRIWWEAGGQELWEGVSEGFEESAVVLDDAIAESWLDQARKIPGWDGGPDYAPNPIVATPLADDEDFV